MHNKALYFPYINIPNTPWLVRALLYWDKVIAIVPSEYIRQSNMLDSHMRDLISAELVEPLSPLRHISKVSEFRDIFLQYVRQQYSQSNSSRKSFSRRIHMEKMEYLSGDLVRMGFAEKIDDTWFKVERRVADDFMVYLSLFLGQVSDINAVPVTDKVPSLRLLSCTTSNQSEKRKQIREIILPGLLPSPSQLIDIEDLIQFKSRHGQLLSDFRRKIESLCIEISSIDDPDLMEEQIQYKLEELRDDIDEIRSYMRRRWQQITYGTLMPLLTAGGSLLATPLTPPLAVLGAMTLANAVYQALENERQHQEHLARPLAYAALAQSHLLQLRS